MTVSLPTDLSLRLDELVHRGRYASSDEAISCAVKLLISREEAIERESAEIRAKVNQALESAERGDTIDGEEFMQSLFARINSES